MKRKLNDEKVPTPVAISAEQQQSTTFESFGLDSRLLQAIAQENFSSPTPVQAEAIPIILDGKDLLGLYLNFITTQYLTSAQLERRPALARPPPTFSQY